MMATGVTRRGAPPELAQPADPTAPRRTAKTYRETAAPGAQARRQVALGACTAYSKP